MDIPKLKNLISVMYLDVITGDVHTRNLYMNTLLTHISICLRAEKLDPKQHALERFRTHLHNSIVMIIRNNHPLPMWDTTREQEIKKLEQYFNRFVIKVDPVVADEKGVVDMGVIEDIETLEYSRNVCYSASADYSNALTGHAPGLTDASNKFAYIINLVTPIIYRYNMVDISATDFSKAAAFSMKRIESQKEMK